MKMFIMYSRLSSRGFQQFIIKKYSTEPQLLKNHLGDKQILTINRPKALNSLNLHIVKEISNTFKNLDKQCFVILKSVGDKAFIAGGDLWEYEKCAKSRNSKESSILTANLAKSIYLIHTSKVPTITIASGVVIGSGIGYPLVSKYTIVTEKTSLFIPEARIGYSIISGFSYYLSKLEGKLGYYLCLTGSILKGSDMVKAGLATHFCYSRNLNKLEEQLIRCSEPNEIEETINNSSETDLPELSLLPVMGNIKTCFTEPTIERIILKLNEDDSDWSRNINNILRKCSPSSLKVILRMLQKGKNMGLKDCLLMETNVHIQDNQKPDAHEGMRIFLRAKNETPRWIPANLENITEDAVEAYFKPTYRSFEQILADVNDEKSESVDQNE